MRKLFLPWQILEDVLLTEEEKNFSSCVNLELKKVFPHKKIW